jgi:hypothetical protein
MEHVIGNPLVKKSVPVAIHRWENQHSAPEASKDRDTVVSESETDEPKYVTK